MRIQNKNVLPVFCVLMFLQMPIQAAEKKEFSPFFVNNVLPVSIGLGLLDGETYSLDIGLAYGLSKRWQLDAQISYIRHTAGSLDGLIDGWHDFFGQMRLLVKVMVLVIYAWVLAIQLNDLRG